MNIKCTAAEDEADAAVLEQAADVLAARWGVLAAGESIALLRNRAAAVRPAAEPAYVLTVEDTMDYNRDYCGQSRDDEPGHGYHEAGDYS